MLYDRVKNSTTVRQFNGMKVPCRIWSILGKDLAVNNCIAWSWLKIEFVELDYPVKQ